MTANTFSVVDEEYMHAVLRREIYRIHNAAGDASCYSLSSTGQAHEDLVLTCKACRRDTTELERALAAFKSAAVYLKHVTNMEREYLRQAVDTHKLRPNEEDVT